MRSSLRASTRQVKSKIEKKKKSDMQAPLLITSAGQMTEKICSSHG